MFCLWIRCYYVHKSSSFSAATLLIYTVHLITCQAIIILEDSHMGMMHLVFSFFLVCIVFHLCDSPLEAPVFLFPPFLCLFICLSCVTDPFSSTAMSWQLIHKCLFYIGLWSALIRGKWHRSIARLPVCTVMTTHLPNYFGFTEAHGAWLFWDLSRGLGKKLRGNGIVL